ncbi:MAG: UDP-N-acetylmuramate dehydrogenase [Ruminococcaceae bacterium]|nr:UDP-N-acetylmuramate dehydrogenase [Oscillospiraceae bacterium]
MTGALQRELQSKGIPFRSDVSSASLCSFRIGGTAKLVIEPQCVHELIAAVGILEWARAPYAVVGRGSNVLFGDSLGDTVLLRTVLLDGICRTEQGIRVMAGHSLPSLFRRTARMGFSDLLFACGIPGTLGAAVLGNAGAYGKSMGDLVKSVTALFPENGEIRTLFYDQLNYSYRNSTIKEKNVIVLEAELRLSEAADPTWVVLRARELSRLRASSQPLELPNAGSIFLRPSPELPIGKLLDEAGVKGLSCGGAAVSEKHAGFIVNQGDATAADVKALIQRIQDITERRMGIRPQPEIRFIPS